MSFDVWENIPKNQIDPEKIEEAIARLISAHVNDESAHLGPNQSLQSHKASEIIDHRMSSIVGEIIRSGAISFEKMAFDEFHFQSCFESIDSWIKSSSGITQSVGGILLQTGSTENDVCYMIAESVGDDTVLDLSKYTFFQAAIKLDIITNVNVYVIAGSAILDGTDVAIGFKVENGKLYGLQISSDGTSQVEHKEEITGITLTKFNVLRVEYFPNSNEIVYSVNGEIKKIVSFATSELISGHFITLKIITLENVSKRLYVKHVEYAKKI